MRTVTHICDEDENAQYKIVSKLFSVRYLCRKHYGSDRAVYILILCRKIRQKGGLASLTNKNSYIHQAIFLREQLINEMHHITIRTV